MCYYPNSHLFTSHAQKQALLFLVGMSGREVRLWEYQLRAFRPFYGMEAEADNKQTSS